jgi:crotonobetainyl-CoA:carnitine CoA-transferase CaiB-like acyl-CoA transferase
MPDRILEIGQFAAGYCGRLFAHTGHDVVRIEPGAAAPGWVGPAASDLYLHAGKRRVAAADHTLIAELAGRAQVVIAEAATADELAGLGFDDWRTPVKVAITPFGRTGPKRNWQATPHVLLAMGGYTQLMGDADRAPLSLPGHYLEFQTGQYAYVAANACRLAGANAAIDIGMFETLMSLSQFTTIQWHCMGEIRSRHGNEFWAVCPTNLYRLRDGWVYVNIVPAFWDAFTLFIERPELLVDERFLTNDLRMAHRDELNAIVAAVVAQFDRIEANRRAADVRIPAGVVQTLDEVLDDPHLAARGFWQTIRATDGTQVRAPALPWRLDGLPHPALELTEPEQARHA